MGVGKSSVGKLLAEKLNRQYFNIDDRIVESAGKPITKIFEENGEEHFRQLEYDALKSVAEEKNAVISCGGGIVMKNDNMKIISETGTSVFLSAATDTLIERIGDSTGRPLLNGIQDEEKFEKIKNSVALRLPKYLSADFTLDTNDKTIEIITDEIIGQLNL